MSYYDVQSWQGPARQPSWDQQTLPSRSGKTYPIQEQDKTGADNTIGSSSVMQHEDNLAFWLQIDGMNPSDPGRAVVEVFFGASSHVEP